MRAFRFRVRDDERLPALSQAERLEAVLGMIRSWLAGWRARTGSTDRHRQQLRKQLIVLAEDFLRAG
jgi:hypothetical protein